MAVKDSSHIPSLALCPRCHFAINPRECYSVAFCMPARLPPPPPSTTPADRPAGKDRDGEDKPAHSPPLAQSESDRPSSPLDPPSSTRSPSPEQPHSVTSSPPPSPTGVSNPTPSTLGKGRRSSAASTVYEFEEYSINGEIEAGLREVEDQYFSQVHGSLSSSPSTESSLVPSTLDEQPSLPIGRRWVVFRGRTPGVYTTSVSAIEQTKGFPDAFKLAFEDPAQADNAFDKFREDGTIPAHGRGPWVVFIGRKQGVFTCYNDLRESVCGFPSNVYRCCESVEEGQRALDKYLSQQAGTSGLSLVPDQPERLVAKLAAPGPVGHPILDAPTDESWWCCFAGAKPGVYMGLDSLRKAHPASGGVRQAASEEDGWEMWTAFLLAGQVRIVPRSPGK